MTIALCTFVAVFAALSLAGYALFWRSGTLVRLSRAVASSPSSADVVRKTRGGHATAAMQFIAALQRWVPKSKLEVSVIQARLARAGYRERAQLNFFYGTKIAVPALLCAFIALSGLSELAGYFIYVVAAGLGFLIPDFWLGSLIKRRQTNLRLGLPDALDLILICVEAGLGVDRAIVRTAEELSLSQPEVADEFTLVSYEQRAGRTRADAWKNLGERTGVDSIRTLASTLIQADKFGTSIGKTLRAQADTLRTRRRQEAEELAAKTTVKLTFPLVLCIMPALFVVTLGPTLISVMEDLEKYIN